MRNRVLLRAIILLIPLFTLTAGIAAAQSAEPATTAGAPSPAQAQNPETEKLSRKPARRPGRVTVVRSQTTVAPQVVTIIHRLSGVKILRLLLRQSVANGVVETIDPETVNNDAHASIIAGWAMDDGKTIAARLPQAAAEIEIKEFEGPPADQKSGLFATSPFSFVRPAVEPDLTVVTRDGRTLKARLIGLDAETGLSVMQVAGVLTPLPKQSAIMSLVEGQALEIFAPEPARAEGEASTFNTFVRIGRIDATVSKLNQESSGVFNKLILRGAQFSPEAVGGVACDAQGNTLGIVDSIDGHDANIVSAKIVRAATRRVLERQASVPRPVLGVRGELVQAAQRAEFLAHGWRDEQLDDLINAQMGILLTGVMPRTPAALARLQAGDVILRVNQNEIKSTEQFSRLLGEAGSGERVEFTIKRPDAAAPFSVPVTLGGSFSPMFEWRFEMPRIKPLGLQAFGIETMALTPRVAAQLGAESGLIVVAVRTDSAGAEAGVREGDVIESVDGRIADRGIWTNSQLFTPQKKHTLAIVRAREKKRVVVEVKGSIPE
ncbi:MAG TPA: PDZ domain-containing protein [Pyrinomonadaceae bacterium]|nr:PDZ domain-containing protein [Pyrinomonadaceae bacterium]